MFDLFICHASEDKEPAVRPLACSLMAAGLDVWYDEFSLKLGDSLRESIDRGLACSRYGVVVLSPDFFRKRWPQAELNGLFAREMHGSKVILPVWHNVDHEEVLAHSPILADRVAIKTSEGIDKVVEKILEVLEPGASHATRNGLTVSLNPSSVRLHTGEWSVKTPVMITNRGDSPLYSIGVKITVETKGVNSESVQIEPDSKTSSVVGRAGHVRVSPEYCIDCIDSQGREAVAIFFHTIGAKQSREFVLWGTLPVPSSARIELWQFEKEPPVMLEKLDSAAMRLRVPERVALKSIRAKFLKP